MRCAVTGASGLVGRAIVAALRERGATVLRLVRREATRDDEVRWDPLGGTVESAKLEGLDVVVHLAGESVQALRWTEAKKKRLAESRVKGTETLVGALARLDQPPRTHLAASAIGFYGSRGDAVSDESTSPGDGFLSRLCIDWEERNQRLEAAGTRVVIGRVGLVLSPDGGLLKSLRRAFAFGGGATIGSGDQWMSWITRDDLVGGFLHALDHGLDGPVNLCAPNPVTMSEFNRTLGRVMRRPVLLKMPAFAARLAFGREMADEMFLASIRATPGRLTSADYTFRDPHLEPALRRLLGVDG